MNHNNNYLLIAMHPAYNHTLTRLRDVQSGNIEFAEIKGEKYAAYVYNDEYTILFTEIMENEIDNSIAKLKNIVNEEKLNKKNTFAILHGDGRPFDTIPAIGLPNWQIKLFSGDLSLAGYFANSILNVLMDFPKKPKKIHSWSEVERFYHSKWPEFLIQNLSPLHLALQAFFGLSKDENNDWKNIPDDLPEETKNNFSTILSEEIREKAFLLVKEANYDFFAEIGSRLEESDESTRSAKKPLEKRTILELIDELDYDNEIKRYKHFLDLDCQKIDGYDLKKELEKIISDCEALKSVCAILANIKAEDDSTNPMLSDKTEQTQENSDIREYKNRISASKNVLKKIPTCKVWFKKEPHSKWPTDLEGDGNQPDESYRHLVEQLHLWNRDGKLAKVALEQIETMAYYLGQIIDYQEEKDKL